MIINDVCPDPYYGYFKTLSTETQSLNNGSKSNFERFQDQLALKRNSIEQSRMSGKKDLFDAEIRNKRI
jgi:hypothetical protein